MPDAGCHELRCQYRKPHWSEPCGKLLGAARTPMVPTGRMLTHVGLRRSGCDAVWCTRCGVATEYRPAARRIA